MLSMTVKEVSKEYSSYVGFRLDLVVRQERKMINVDEMVMRNMGPRRSNSN